MRSKLLPLLAGAAFAGSVGSAAAYEAVTNGPAYLRSGPGMRYHRVATVAPNTPIDVAGCGPAWCQVRYGGAAAYIDSAHVARAAGPMDSGPLGLLTMPFNALGQAFDTTTAPAGDYPTDTGAPVVAAY